MAGNAVTDEQSVQAEIARLEARIEHLADSVERARKIIVFSKLALAIGAGLAVALLLGLMTSSLAMIVAITAIFGGIVGFGSNVSTMRQDTAALKAAESRRAALIGSLELREVGTGSGSAGLLH